MKYTLALLSVLGTAAAQGITESIAPPGSYPAGCKKSADGPMWVSVLDVKASKREIQERAAQACTEGNLQVSLANGVLTDGKGRTGYIAANYQFQFDAPAQTGAISTAGYSLCGNSSLALGPTTTFFKCRSGDFWNLYDRSWAAQCEPVQLAAYPCSGAGTGGSGQKPDGQVTGGAGQIGDGQVVATNFITTTIVKPIGDGQPQVITTVVPVPMCQIGDGQVQAHPTPCAPIGQIPDGQPQVTSGKAPVSQIGDGQPQVPTGKPVSQIGDGQPQVPTGKPVSQIGDGQPQVPTGKPVSQISDGQPQVPTGNPVGQISDGQPQVTKAPPPVSQHSDGQPQATSAAKPSPSQVQTAGAGRVEMGSVAALVVGIVGGLAIL